MSAGLQQPKKPAGGSFGVFMSEKRAEFIKATAGQPATASIKMGSAVWKELPDAEKAVYQKQYEEKKATFEKDMAAFLASGGEKTKGAAGLRREKRLAKEGKKKSKKDANAPKKPAGGGYGVYIAENREAIVKSLPAGANKITDVAKKGSEQWNKLSEAEKKPFTDKFVEKQEAYKVALEEYEKTLPEEAEEGSDDDAAEEEDDSPKKSPKRKVQDEILAEASPSKKARKVDDSAVMDVAKKEGLQIKLKSMLDNPKLGSKGPQVLLDALRKADGKVVEAKRLLA